MEFDINDLKVLYEDNHIIVVVKPVGIPVQQDKTGDIDMLSIIKEYLREKYNKPGNVYLGLVHRLDRMVGGVMVFAKTSMTKLLYPASRTIFSIIFTLPVSKRSILLL